MLMRWQFQSNVGGWAGWSLWECDKIQIVVFFNMCIMISPFHFKIIDYKSHYIINFLLQLMFLEIGSKVCSYVIKL